MPRVLSIFFVYSGSTLIWPTSMGRAENWNTRVFFSMWESGGNNVPYAHNYPFISERDPYFNFIVLVVTIAVPRHDVKRVALHRRLFVDRFRLSFFYRRRTRPSSRIACPVNSCRFRTDSTFYRPLTWLWWQNGFLQPILNKTHENHTPTVYLFEALCYSFRLRL